MFFTVRMDNASAALKDQQDNCGSLTGVEVAPIDLAVALESACWDLDFLVCWLYSFVTSVLS